MKKMNKMYEKVKDWLLDDSKGYRMITTTHQRPRFVLFGFIYMVVSIIALFLVVESGIIENLAKPLEIFQPVTKFFINWDTGEPRNILGWLYILIVVAILGLLLLGFMILLLWPGVYFMAVKGSEILDREWPDDPERTKKWCDKHAKK